MANKFKKGDQVIIIAGSNRGKIGSIIAVDGEKILVEGVNLATVHKKPTSNQPGEIVKVVKPLHISNVSHIEDGKPVKIKFKVEDGEGEKHFSKIRVSKKTGKKID